MLAPGCLRAAVAALCLLVPPGPAQTTAIYVNGKVVTGEPERPLAEAFAIADSRFLAVGSNQEIRKLAGADTRIVDLGGRTVLPGLIESHVHPIGAALSEADGPVPVMRSVPEIQAYVREQAAKRSAGELIFVPKIYGTRLVERRYPTRWELDAAAPGRLVVADNGYAAVLSTALLEKLGIDRDTPDPANGKLIRDAHGNPTGLILGARQLVAPTLQSRATSHAEMREALERMIERYNRVGITSILDRGQGPDGFRVYQDLRAQDKLTLRANVTYRISAAGTPEQVAASIRAIPFTTGWGDEWLRVGALKTVVDGGILIGTARLRAPYGEHTEVYGYKDPDYRGVLNVPRENLYAMARTAGELGWQMTSHVAGGGAIDLLLDAYEEADKARSIRGRRFTVTHGNFPDPRAIERAARLGVAFDCQPAWLHFDAPALEKVFGPERIRHFLPLRSMLDAGVVVAGGSDHMIRLDSRESLNPYNPFLGMWMAITRQLADGRVLNPAERITREEALRLWTWNGAWLTFEEEQKGSIAAGKLADFVVIDRDFLTCPEDQIKDIEAVLTVVGGRTVYGRL